MGHFNLEYNIWYSKMMKINEAIGNISEWTNYHASKQSNLKILERLAEKGHLQNTKKCEGFEFDMLHTSSFLKVICSMKNLEKLTLKTYHLTLEDLAPVFQSCSNLIELNIFATGSEIDEMGEVLIDQLRSGFRRLRRLDVACSIVEDSWQGIQEMLT